MAGNLDPVQEVMRSTPERIRAGFRELYEIANLEALCEPIPAG